MEPLLQRLFYELRTVVTTNVFRSTMPADQTEQLIKNIPGLYAPGNMNQVAFSGMLIHHSQHFKPSATDRTVMNEIPGPYMPPVVRLRRQPGRTALPAPFGLSLGYTKPKLTANRLNHSLAYLPAIVLQELGDFWIAPTTMLQGIMLYGGPQMLSPYIRLLGPIPIG